MWQIATCIIDAAVVSYISISSAAIPVGVNVRGFRNIKAGIPLRCRITRMNT